MFFFLFLFRFYLFKYVFMLFIHASCFQIAAQMNVQPITLQYAVQMVKRTVTCAHSATPFVRILNLPWSGKENVNQVCSKMNKEESGRTTSHPNPKRNSDG